MNELLKRMEIERLVARSCWCLDERKYDEWVNLFSKDGTYEIRTYSPEIRKNMIWMSNDKEQLAQLLKELPKHVIDQANRRHVFSLVDVQFEHEEKARVTTNFSLFRTDISGKSSLYIVGEYYDVCILEDNQWLIQERKTYLDTRQLDLQSQYPV